MKVYNSSGVLMEDWDDVAHVVKFYTNGVETSSRPYTAEEEALAVVRAEQMVLSNNQSTVEKNLEQDYLNMQAIEGQSNAELRTDPSQEIKDIARAIRRLTRMALDDFSGSD